MEQNNTPSSHDAKGKFKLLCSTETATSRPIHTASDCLGPRGDEKSGCQAEWQAICDTRNIKTHMMSYQGNRFNSLFEDAAAVVHLEADITSFLSSGSLWHSNLKPQSVEAETKDDWLLALLCAVAILCA